jgi:abortive infection bacteriophage resistance protein
MLRIEVFEDRLASFPRRAHLIRRDHEPGLTCTTSHTRESTPLPVPHAGAHMPDKEFKTYGEQIALLKSRGLHVEDDSQAIRILGDENYYNVINGYKLLFVDGKDADGNDLFRTRTDFSEIYALFQFDTAMRNSCLKKILEVERHVKSVIAYEFSQKYGHKHTDYLSRQNFDAIPDREPKAWRTPQWLTEKEWKGAPANQPATRPKTYADGMIEAVSSAITEAHNVHNSSIRHYETQYGYLPLWVLVNVLTMGTTAMFYRCMHADDRKLVADRFHVDPNVLADLLQCLTLFRNCCAHGARFYEFELMDYAVPRTRWDHKVGYAPGERGETMARRKKAFSLMIILRMLLPLDSFSELCSEIDSLMATLSPRLLTVNIEDVRRKMAFPSDWHQMMTV